MTLCALGEFCALTPPQLSAGAVPFILEFLHDRSCSADSPGNYSYAILAMRWLSKVCSEVEACKVLLVECGVAPTLASLLDGLPTMLKDEKMAPFFTSVAHSAVSVSLKVIAILGAEEARCLLAAFVELCDRVSAPSAAAQSKDVIFLRRHVLVLVLAGCQRGDAVIPSRTPLLAMGSLPPLPSMVINSTQSDQNSVGEVASLLSKTAKPLPFETLPCALLLCHHLASVELPAALGSNLETIILASLSECFAAVQHAACAMASSQALLESMASLPGAQDGFCADSFLLSRMGLGARKGKNAAFFENVHSVGVRALRAVARKAGAHLPASVRKCTLDSVLVRLQSFASEVTQLESDECDRALHEISLCAEAVETLLQPVPAFCDIDPAIISSAIDAAMRPLTAREGESICPPF